MSAEFTTVSYAGGTDKGKVREQNEDSILTCNFAHSDVTLLIVADGVGGHEGGEVASKLAVDSVKSFVEKAVLQSNSGGGYAENWLELTLQHALADANQVLLNQQIEQPQYSEMATTIVVMLIKQQQVALSHLGDSRCYLSSNEMFVQLTEDHTVLQKLLNEGRIDQQQFETLPMHHMINQALGLIESPEIYAGRFEFQKGATYLLCSDGLTNCISDAQIQHIINQHQSLGDCVDELITQANDNGGVDNISVVLVRQ